MTDINGIFIPVAFRLYRTFESHANDKFELTLAYPQYRAQLSQTIQQTHHFEQFMPTNNMSVSMP